MDTQVSDLRWPVLIATVLLFSMSCSLPWAAAEVATEEPPQIARGEPPPAAALPPTTRPENPPEKPPNSQVEPAEVLPANLVQAADFTYQGAFRLPDAGERPRTFAYGGAAMTVNPGGDPGGSGDDFPGSLFVMGHDRIPYGELADGSQVAEVNIPAPLISKDLVGLPQAKFLQGFENVAKNHFANLEEIPRVGMQFLEHPLTGPKIHITWGAHFQEDERTRGPALAWFNPNLTDANMQGEWYLGQQAPYSVNGYMLTIPPDWAERFTHGRLLGTGRYKDGGWSGMGPALFAYRPWDDGGQPAPNGTHFEETVLLLYGKSTETTAIEHALAGYQHPDEWEGAAWLTTPSGKQAVLFAGTKGTGDIYWYGFVNPQGPDKPCAFAEYIGQYDLCRFADGRPCPMEMQQECAGHTSERGWWSSRKNAQFILYDPETLGRVALGQIQPWEPQPYAVVNIDEVLLMNPSGVEEALLGTGEQRRYRIGDATYDRQHGLLYVLELFADEAKPIVHVWRLK